jgi:Tol biopolymer transport system component
MSVRALTGGVAGISLAVVSMLPGGSAAGSTGSAAGTAQPPPVVADPLSDVGAPALSYSGRYLAYVAIRRDQTSPAVRVRRVDLRTGGDELLNPSVDGGVARGNYSRPPVISSDGARVAYTSNATRLVADDDNASFDAFVRSAPTGTTLLASAALDGGAANGATGMTSLSKNGRYVVFTSGATDVVAGSTTTNTDVYRRDLRTRTTVQVTVRRDGSPSKGPGSTSADVSADGTFVAFNSYDTDLVPTDGADQDSDLFVRDMSTGRTRWLSKTVPTGANPSAVVISPDGRWVSSRWDDGSLHLTRVDSGVTSTVVADGYAVLGSFSSALGRYVFISAGRPYVRDLSTGADTALRVPDSGVATTVTISGDGRFAAYDWTPGDGGPSRIYRVGL